MRRISLSLIMLVFACSKPEVASTPEPVSNAAKTASSGAPKTHSEEIEEWRAGRLKRLQSETGWLTLIGLQWLKEGENKVEKLPVEAMVSFQKGTATLAPNEKLTIDGKPVSAAVVLLDDTAPTGATVVQTGTFRFNVIKRADKWALRIRDTESRTRKEFQGIENFPVDEKWRVTARFEPFNPPKTVQIANITGITTEEKAPGELVFTLEGKEHRMLPILEGGTTDYFLIFKDQTSGKETYGAARFVYAKPADANGTTVIDFNKAYNPPCVFTPYATCPLPPPQNRLPIRVEAGEKNYAGHV